MKIGTVYSTDGFLFAVSQLYLNLNKNCRKNVLLRTHHKIKSKYCRRFLYIFFYYISLLYLYYTKQQNVIFLEFQEAFHLFDNRGDGKIHVAQIGDALRALGQNPTESDVKKYTHQYKPDERVSFEVFLPIYQVISVLQIQYLR